MALVLVMDDDEGTRETFTFLLRQANFDVVTASMGHEGLRLALGQPIDVILADLELPDMTGLEFLRMIRPHALQARVIVITGFGSIRSAVEAIKLGAVDFVEKPVSATDLTDMVELNAMQPASSDADGVDGHISIDAFVPRAANITHPAAERALALISERYAVASLSLGSVAREIGMSSEHLSRLLTRHTGQGFVAHVRFSRISAARRYLNDTTLSMKEIAGRVGYQRASHFDSDFKKVCGLPPSWYRRRAWQQAPPDSLK